MKRRVRGQSLVEMALVLPFLVLFTIGTAELSYYIYSYSELEDAARRASEWASKTPPLDPGNANDPGDQCLVLIKQHAIDGVFLSRLQPSNVTISFPGEGRRAVGAQVQANVTYQGQWLSPIGRRFFGNALKFNFTSIRTITDTSPPPGLDDQCE
jgi:Flp pilus assembly protein TadG